MMGFGAVRSAPQRSVANGAEVIMNEPEPVLSRPCWFLQFEVTPRADHPETDVIAGGLVNCWVLARTALLAIGRARRGISSAGWIVDEPEEVCEVDVNTIDWDADEEDLEYLRQACIDGEVYVFHLYPVDEDEED